MGNKTSHKSPSSEYSSSSSSLSLPAESESEKKTKKEKKKKKTDSVGSNSSGRSFHSPKWKSHNSSFKQFHKFEGCFSFFW
jgi:hypothetical protein